MRKKISFILVLVLLLSLCPLSASAAGEGLENFKKVNSYTPGQFSDVAEGVWYTPNIALSYELGLVKGNADGSYNPFGNIKLSETLALACRLHNIYYGGSGQFTQGALWYQVYVDYALANGIIYPGQFADFNAYATRLDFVSILAAALPDKALEPMNSIEYIPDLSYEMTEAIDVFKFYRAGILKGSDAQGNFMPYSNIKRSEVATIVARMAEPDMREALTITSPYPDDVCVIAEKTVVNIVGDVATSVKFTMPAANITADGFNSDFNVASVSFSAWQGDDIWLKIDPINNGSCVVNVGLAEYPNIFAMIVINVSGVDANKSLSVSTNSVTTSGITSVNINSKEGKAVSWDYDSSIVELDYGPWDGYNSFPLYIIPVGVGECDIEVFESDNPDVVEKIHVKVTSLDPLSVSMPAEISAGSVIRVSAPSGESINWSWDREYFELAAGEWSPYCNLYYINVSPKAAGTGTVDIWLDSAPDDVESLQVNITGTVPRISVYDTQPNIYGPTAIYVNVRDQDFYSIHYTVDTAGMISLSAGEWENNTIPLVITPLQDGYCELQLNIDNDPSTAITLYLYCVVEE